MRIIEGELGHNHTVELDPIEVRHSAYIEDLLDEGWDLITAVKYSERRFGPMTPAFRHHVLY